MRSSLPTQKSSILAFGMRSDNDLTADQKETVLQYKTPLQKMAITNAQVISAAIPQNIAHASRFEPGILLRVGLHKVVVEKFLSEGGFSHVYLVRVVSSPEERSKNMDAVLKRMLAPDRDSLVIIKSEVDTMKLLKGHPKIVSYIDSHVSQSPRGGFEVFVLMEFCSGGGLIDFMNNRLRDRLTEYEVLEIAIDIAEAVSKMHSFAPPLIHRDLKVENILCSKSGYKLCDFGSTCNPIPAWQTKEEYIAMDQNLQRYTTLQYRSPEMLDLRRRQIIDEKSDIWAFGVLVYKLCYYTTPFESSGLENILRASFSFPVQPVYSQGLKRFIAILLQEDPRMRPNISQTLRELYKMQNTKLDNQLSKSPSVVTIPATNDLSIKESQENLPSEILEQEASKKLYITKPQETNFSGSSVGKFPSITEFESCNTEEKPSNEILSKQINLDLSFSSNEEMPSLKERIEKYNKSAANMELNNFKQQINFEPSTTPFKELKPSNFEFETSKADTSSVNFGETNSSSMEKTQVIYNNLSSSSSSISLIKSYSGVQQNNITQDGITDKMNIPIDLLNFHDERQLYRPQKLEQKQFLADAGFRESQDTISDQDSLHLYTKKLDVEALEKKLLNDTFGTLSSRDKIDAQLSKEGLELQKNVRISQAVKHFEEPKNTKQIEDDQDDHKYTQELLNYKTNSPRKAVDIQNRINMLISANSDRLIKRTAENYGRYTMSQK